MPSDASLAPAKLPVRPRPRPIGASWSHTRARGTSSPTLLATWSASPPKEDKVKAFFGLHQLLPDVDYIRQGGTAVQRLVGDYGHKLQDGYSVIMRFACSAHVPKMSRLRKAAAAAEGKYGEG